jgi:bifunctional DNA-binding transcriptional regulator/antitoxin component of YhaV-PrlF toxin-antitoxin module
MQIKVQDCGCIALPDELTKSLAAGPGSVFEATLEGDDRLVLTRISAASKASVVEPRANCLTSADPLHAKRMD